MKKIAVFASISALEFRVGLVSYLTYTRLSVNAIHVLNSLRPMMGKGREGGGGGGGRGGLIMTSVFFKLHQVFLSPSIQALQDP